MKGMCVLLFVQVFIFGGMSAQGGNPFELRWKKGTDTLYTYEESVEAPTQMLKTGSPDTISEQTPVTVTPGNSSVADSTPASASEEEPEGDLAVVEPPPLKDEIQEENRSSPERTEPEKDEGPRSIASPLVLLLLFGLVFVILTWAVNLTPGLVRKIYRAAFNENFSALLLREHKFASTQYLYYLVYIVFFINCGIFLYFLSRYSGWRFGYEQSPLIVFIGFVCFVYLIRHVVLSIIGITFPVSKEVTHFSFNIILYNILLGLTLIPINLFLAFGPVTMRSWMIIIGLSAIGLFYLLRQARGIMIGGHLIGKNVFQFFVYLCTIEILPVLVLLKFFHN